MLKRGSFDEPSDSARVYWNAPEDTEENRNSYMGEFPTVMVTVTDSLGQQASGFGNLLLSQDITTTYSSIVGGTQNRQNGGCALGEVSPSWPASLLAALWAGLGLAARRRRSR